MKNVLQADRTLMRDRLIWGFAVVRRRQGRPPRSRRQLPGLHAMPRSKLQMTSMALTAAGGAGFVGLLVAAYYIAPWAGPLRIFAFVWFLGFGVAKVALYIIARPSGADAPATPIREGPSPD